MIHLEKVLMRHFYLVRHAHSDWSPDENRPLSEKGFKEAARVADVLSAYPITQIYSSPYLRARQTIQQLASRLNIQVQIESDLQERILSCKAVDDFLDAIQQTWEDPYFAHPGGESNRTAQNRAIGVITRILESERDEHIVLSTHGNLLAVLLQKYDPSIDFAFWRSLTFPDIYKLSINSPDKGIIEKLWD